MKKITFKGLCDLCVRKALAIECACPIACPLVLFTKENLRHFGTTFIVGSEVSKFYGGFLYAGNPKALVRTFSLDFSAGSQLNSRYRIIPTGSTWSRYENDSTWLWCLPAVFKKVIGGQSFEGRVLIAFNGNPNEIPV